MEWIRENGSSLARKKKGWKYENKQKGYFEVKNKKKRESSSHGPTRPEKVIQNM